MRTRAGRFLYGAGVRFHKPPLSFKDQIKLLKQRGVIFYDENLAEFYLRHISYYRLSAYCLAFEQPSQNGRSHKFCEGTSFDDIIALYGFDRELRLLVMDALERVEVSVRGNWAYHMAMTYGPHGYLDRALYRDMTRYEDSLKKLEDEVKGSKEIFITSYRGKYTDPLLPPVWMVAEIFSFGTLSQWIYALKKSNDRNEISRHFDLDEQIFTSILRHFSYIRNICAHHGRLWDRDMSIKIKIPVKLSQIIKRGRSDRIYATLIMLGYFMDQIAPHHSWWGRLSGLFNRYPSISYEKMGFPAGEKNISFPS